DISNQNNSEKWYGCVVLNEELEPILFPLSRSGEMMDGAGIEDPTGAYDDLGRGGVAVIQCQFKKDGVVISPEEASQEFEYDDLDFNTLILAKAAVNALMGQVDNVWEMYKESSEKFQTMLASCMEDVVEQENPDKKYLAFSIYEEKEDTQSMFVMNKLGRMYPKFKFKGGKTDSKDNLNEGSIYEIQFQDGTLPITIKEANGRMQTDAENIFLSAELIGAVKLKEDYKFQTWEEAVENDYDSMEPLMKHSMLSLKENNDKMKEEENTAE
ncbi:MAG: hypothetical protein P8J32_08355, partial [bacterium]|nr:hypothetical protein [bacterium]